MECSILLQQEKLPKGWTKEDKKPKPCSRKCALDGRKIANMPEISLG